MLIMIIRNKYRRIEIYYKNMYFKGVSGIRDGIQVYAHESSDHCLIPGGGGPAKIYIKRHETEG